ncbi:hypothetical protein DSM3645_12556 [Blastopirellula marina DSM 3645]|uniref:Uncharacterized protein n=1 Tax=Blastopirellula marina DSM 3645 TaxID=314230 RepID=A3ZRT1_9BACT|nr:hypothetical protein DSM3645_12556 [Blastopirellula marina DSM 3645]
MHAAPIFSNHRSGSANSSLTTGRSNAAVLRPIVKEPKMRKPTIFLASLVMLASAVGTSAAKQGIAAARPIKSRRLTPLCCSANQLVSTILVAPRRSTGRVGKPGPMQLAIKAKRELLKVAISFERYRIAQRKFPLKLHDQLEILPARSSDATWSIPGDYSQLACSAADAWRL